MTSLCAHTLHIKKTLFKEVQARFLQLHAQMNVHIWDDIVSRSNVICCFYHMRGLSRARKTLISRFLGVGGYVFSIHPISKLLPIFKVLFDSPKQYLVLTLYAKTLTWLFVWQPHTERHIATLHIFVPFISKTFIFSHLSFSTAWSQNAEEQLFC